MASVFAAYAVSGPPVEDGLPVFSWKQFNGTKHQGLPEFYNFDFVTMRPILWNWYQRWWKKYFSFFWKLSFSHKIKHSLSPCACALTALCLPSFQSFVLWGNGLGEAPSNQSCKNIVSSMSYSQTAVKEWEQLHKPAMNEEAPWASHFTSLCLNFSIFKIWMMLAFPL